MSQPEKRISETKMKGTRQMKTQTTLGKLLPTLALAAIFSLGAATSAQAAFNSFRTGMFGVAIGQVARINAANLGGPDTRPIQVEMMFLDGTGAVVGRDTQMIAPGQAVIFDAGVREANRIELRAVIGASTRRTATRISR